VKENKKSWDLNLPSLAKAYENHFLIGNIISPLDLKNEETCAMLKHHYCAVTAENAMKPVYVAQAKDSYHFDEADALVHWANDNGLKMIGHTFVWHGQSAPWLNKNEDGSVLTRAEAKANMESFIKTYASRYSGKIYSWDVMNEIFRDSGTFSGNWRDSLRADSDNARAVAHWYLAYENSADADKGESGSDYVFDAFYFARKYDPNAILYYNDYNEEVPPKRDAIAAMVEEINAMWQAHPEYDQRLLIEGIGMQGHCNHNTNLEWVRLAVERFVQTGAKISVTELDITFGSQDAPAIPLTEEQSLRQAEMYRYLFNLYVEYAEHIERVTFWAKDDGSSWRSWGQPVLFDENGNAKESFCAVMNVAKCACKNHKCPRKADCNVCAANHAGKEYPPACKR